MTGKLPAEEKAELERLRQENEQLTATVDQLDGAMQSRPVIDQARGMIMAAAPCGPETAWKVLVGVSQHTNTKLRHVAGALTASSVGTPLPPAYRQELATAFKHLRNNG